MAWTRTPLPVTSIESARTHACLASHHAIGWRRATHGVRTPQTHPPPHCSIPKSPSAFWPPPWRDPKLRTRDGCGQWARPPRRAMRAVRDGRVGASATRTM
eukprot:scaffold15596_cov22-Tisochrysis_lutea.AAC.1